MAILVNGVPDTRSVNTKALNKDININAEDIGAISNTGGSMNGNFTLNGQLNVTSGVIRSKHDTSGGFHIGGGSSGEGYSELAPINKNETTPLWANSLRYYKTTSDWRFGNSKIYHEGFKPTAADVGALSTSGGTITGSLVINNSNQSYGINQLSNVVTSDKKYLREFRSHSVGTIWHETVQEGAYRLATGSTDSNEVLKLMGSGEGYLRGSRIYTEGFKPTASAIGAVPSTGDSTIDGQVVVRGVQVTGSGYGLQTAIAGAGNMRIGGNTAGGYGEIAGKPSNASDWAWTTGLRYYPDNTWRVGDRKIYHEGFKPSASDIGAVSKGGDTISGNVSIVTNGSTGLTVSAPAYPGIKLESRNLTNERQKIIEVNESGHLNFITRNVGGTNSGVITLPGGINGTVYTTGNKPTAADLNVLPLTGGTMSGVLSSSRKVGQFQGALCGGTSIDDLYSTEAGQWSYVSNISKGPSNLFPATNNANSTLTFNSHPGDYGHQIGMSSNGNLYHRYFKNATWRKIATMSINDDLAVTSLGVTGSASAGSLSVTNGNIVSSSANYLRCIYNGQFGLIHRNDGVGYYMLVTNKGDPNGNFNSLRPFRLDLETGRIYMNNGVSANSISVDGTVYTAGGLVTDNTANGSYKLTMMSNSTTANSKNYLRKFRNHNVGTIWHETVDNSSYRIATGVSDTRELLNLNQDGTLRVDGYIHSSRNSNSAASVLACRNIGTTAGVSQGQLEVTGDGSIRFATHDGTNWYYPLTFFRTSPDLHANGSLNIGGNLVLKPTQGSNSPITIRNWGNATSGRKCVYEMGDSTGYFLYCQRNNDNTVMFNVNGVISTGNVKLNSSGSIIALDDGATLGNSGNNALVRGAIDGGAWTAWKDRASGLQVHTPDSANKAYNIWKAVHPGKFTFAGMQVHCPGSTVASSIVRLNSGDSNFDFNGDGTFVTASIRTTGAIYGGGNGDFNDVHIRSDKRLKSDLKEIKGALSKVNQLTGYTYNKHRSLNDKTLVGHEAGLIAQDLKEVLPEAVNEMEDTTLTVSSAAVNGLLVEAIKELTERVSRLENIIGGK